jgi:polysaccharide biosynthesis protein PslG
MANDERRGSLLRSLEGVYSSSPGRSPSLHRGRRVLRTFFFALIICLGPTSWPPRTIAAPAAVEPVASPEYGISVFIYGNAATTQRDLAKVQALGFGWQKSLFSWREIEGACKGCFRWEESDRVVRASTEAGLKIIARLDFQPGWARKDRAPNGPPDNYQDYAEFVRAFVDRYRSGSSVGTVQAIEIWNEPNLKREWGNQPISRQSAADYVRLLSLAYAAAKSADPSVTVVSAGLSPNGASNDSAQPDDQYLRWMFEAGLRNNYDVLGAHANTQCPCVSPAPGSLPGFDHPSFYFRRVEQLRDIMVANGDSNKQIWLLEFGWTTDRTNASYSWYATTEEKKSELIVEAFRFAHDHWNPWIGVMTLWTISAPGWGANDEQVWWAITNPNGSARPAYDRLIRARASGELPLPAAGSVHGTPAPREVPRSAVQTLQVVGTDGLPLNLRAAPGVGAPLIRGLPSGLLVDALGTSQSADGYEWREIRDPDGVSGWAVADFLSVASTDSATSPSAPVQVITEDAYLNLRDAPSTDAELLDLLSPGVTLVALDGFQTNQGRAWRQVQVGGVRGWVAAEFIAPVRS